MLIVTSYLISLELSINSIKKKQTLLMSIKTEFDI